MSNSNPSILPFPTSGISTTELKRLLISIADHPHRINFRYRLIGEMWQSVFMRVLFVTDTGVMLRDEIHNRTILLSELKMVIQFELDSALHNFDPNFHYDVTPYPL